MNNKTSLIILTIIFLTTITVFVIVYSLKPSQRQQADELIKSKDTNDIALGLAVYTHHGNTHDLNKIKPFLLHDDNRIRLAAINASEMIINKIEKYEITSNETIDSLANKYIKKIESIAQQGDAPEPATNAHSASQPSFAPAR
ncbi:hypothetical protein LBMAG53_21820 [Planctomycetota bacterium]|nr:hypothetical protein LBMAG53_21820 [Planctomycetota bacterium]